MKRTRKLGVGAINRSLFLTVCALVLGLAPVSTAAVREKRSLPQAVITYGFLRQDYLDLDKLLVSNKKLPVMQDLRALDEALKSLDCDVPDRLAMPHKALIIPSFPEGIWFGFERIGGRNSPDRGWLFVTRSRKAGSRQVLVVLASASPERTTVFWLEDSDAGYAAKLLYDSLKKGRITNTATIMGAVTEVKVKKTGEVLLKDWGEPGIGPREFTRIGRVFQLKPLQGTVSLVFPETPIRP